MIRLHRHDDIVRLECSSARSRTVGFAVSAYVVRGVLVDTGLPGVGTELVQALDALRPRGAIVTHWHEDHAGNVERLARRDLPLWLAPATLAIVRAPKPIGFYRRWTWGSAAPLRASVTPLDPGPVRILPAPGHTADHHVVWDEDSGTLVGGDLFLGVRVRVAHAYERPRIQVETLRAMAALDPARLLDAHRGVIDRPAALLRAKADWMEETIAAVERLARDGLSPERIRDAVLGREEWTGWFSAGDYSKLNLVRGMVGEPAISHQLSAIRPPDS